MGEGRAAFIVKIWKAIVVCLFLSCTERIVACSCAPRSTAEALSGADIVFRGELIAHRSGQAVFRVDEQWKGHLGKKVSIEWRDGSRGDCNGFWPDQLRIGNKLLVFARRYPFATYKTRICLPTKLVSEAQQELEDLGPGQPLRK